MQNGCIVSVTQNIHGSHTRPELARITSHYVRIQTPMPNSRLASNDGKDKASGFSPLAERLGNFVRYQHRMSQDTRPEYTVTLAELASELPLSVVNISAIKKILRPAVDELLIAGVFPEFRFESQQHGSRKVWLAVFTMPDELVRRQSYW